MKLTEGQIDVLAVLAAHQPFEPSRDALLADGVNMTSVWAVERRGMIDWTRYADGIHFRLTDAGRSALQADEVSK